MRYLLDTCVVSELIRKRPSKSVVAWISEQDEVSLFMSVITFGEIEKGIAKLVDAKRIRKLRSWVDHDLRRRFSGRILDADYEVVSKWGEISGKADVAGTPIPVLDGLLAATAIIHGLTFVTRNVGDVACCAVETQNPWES